MNEPIIIQTERLILKGVTPAKIHELFNNHTPEEIMAFLGIDESGLAHYRNMHERGMETNRLSLFFFLLISKQTGLPLGDCGFHTWNRTHRRAELFYGLHHEEDKKQGYMKEALRAVLQYGYEHLGLHRIEALVGRDNTPSVKLLRHYGFTFEGTMREDYVIDGISQDSDCYSLLRQEWAQQQTTI